MPLYEYQCENCGDVFEVIQKFVDTPLTVHEKCGGAVHRLLSAPALMFKGSGWYVNDYAKGSGNAPNGGSKKGESSENSGKSESSEKSGASSASGSKETTPAKTETKTPAATTPSSTT